MDTSSLYYRNIEKITYDNKYINDFTNDNLDINVDGTMTAYYTKKIINFNNFMKYALPQHLDNLKKIIRLFNRDQNKETYRVINRLANTINATIVRLDVMKQRLSKNPKNETSFDLTVDCLKTVKSKQQNLIETMDEINGNASKCIENLTIKKGVTRAVSRPFALFYPTSPINTCIQEVNNLLGKFNELQTAANDSVNKLDANLKAKINEVNTLVNDLRVSIMQINNLIKDNFVNNDIAKEEIENLHSSLFKLIISLSTTSESLFKLQNKINQACELNEIISECKKNIGDLYSSDTLSKLLISITNTLRDDLLSLADEVNSIENNKQNKIENTKFIVQKHQRCFFSGMVPNLFACYEFQFPNNNQLAVQDLKKMMEGYEVQTQLSKFRSPDRSGNYVRVPHQFYVDLPRCARLVLNQTCLHELKDGTNYNLSEASQTLYKTFGQEPAKRIMNICHQSALAFASTYYVFPSLQNDGILRESLNVEGELTFSDNKSDGITHLIEVDPKSDALVIISKSKLVIKSIIDDKFEAYVVLKRQIQMPLSELKDPEFDQLLYPAPNLKVSDYISQPIINNPNLVEQILQNI